MKVTVLGATGGVGRQVVERALASGHDVRAVVRDPARLTTDVPYVVADFATADSIALEAATIGADVVLSCLGPRGQADGDVASRGVGVTLEAMWASGVRRIVAVSGGHDRDLALMHGALCESRFDWTLVRPHGGSASRTAVAELMLACLADDDTIGQVLRVA